MNTQYLTATVIVTSAVGCANQTGQITNAVLAVSPAVAVDSMAAPFTQIWIAEEKRGNCVVLATDAIVTVDGKPTEVLTRGNTPGWLAKRYNRYAACEAPSFRMPVSAPREGTQMEVALSGSGLAASTRLVFRAGAWAATSCVGVRSCCVSDQTSTPLKCTAASAP